jgi:hypothetical protein
MTENYWAVAFYDRQDSYLWIGWDQSVKESELPEALGFRMVLFKTRAKARAWVKALNERHYYWTQRHNYVVVKRVRVTVAPPPKIGGKPV